MPSIAKTTSKVSKSARTKQRFVRLNIDEKLENVLSEYEIKYSLLNRSDIIRMLLSEAIEIKNNLSKNKVFDVGLDNWYNSLTAITQEEQLNLEAEQILAWKNLKSN